MSCRPSMIPVCMPCGGLERLGIYCLLVCRSVDAARVYQMLIEEWVLPKTQGRGKAIDTILLNRYFSHGSFYLCNGTHNIDLISTITFAACSKSDRLGQRQHPTCNHIRRLILQSREVVVEH